MPNSSPAAAPFTGVRCADIKHADVSWLWEPYLARGKLAVLDGDPGTGKSFVTIDLACRVTRGLSMPDGRANPAAPGASVLLMNAEDDARDTIRPRVLAAGGDPERLRVFAAPGIGLERIPRFPEDFRALEAAVYETQAALVVIDPMTAFFPPDMCAHQSICTALMPLATLAADTGACILLVRHLRKSGGASAIYRGLGSIGILGAVRTGLMVARHPDDPELRALTLSKTNIGPPGPSLGFRLARNEAGQTVVHWTGPLDVTTDDLLGAGTPLRAGYHTRERAAEWLRQFLANGKRRATEVVEAARAAGIPDRTLDRVKATVGVKSDAVKNNDGKIEWWWRDPKAVPAPPADPLREQISRHHAARVAAAQAKPSDGSNAPPR